MVKGLFLDGINTETRRTTVGGKNHLVILSHAYKTRATLTFLQLAVAWAQIALYAAIVYNVPVAARVIFVFFHWYFIMLLSHVDRFILLMFQSLVLSIYSRRSGKV